MENRPNRRRFHRSDIDWAGIIWHGVAVAVLLLVAYFTGKGA